MAAKLLEYADKLEKAGLGENKFRDSRGNVVWKPKAKGSGGGSSASSAGAWALFSGANNPLSFDKSLRKLVQEAGLKG